MTDLRIPAGPGIPHGLVIPETELVERFSRSSGPGGQSVNTTDSRVELVFDASASAVLTGSQQARVGTIRVVASEHRSQHRNRAAARTRLAQQVREALTPPPPPRVPTKPSKASRRRRLEAKRRRGQVKSMRGRVRD
ncbi:alternative ribosome rescue aminoacyl-tRNA hydrolase ArfB [Nocardioides coralli]|uniref:alternative ribosome rescue aminoacyl-tRNA hydrolase ArfB n=1 Tax=Nocardioides coralli TaxID=2872154 RepID=UPI001CA41186|nr:alternative ribosome rescue aminoacyl-tRNA hydrolase ArfB [Nocardioides coralli]QZY29991.1 aminoacyl-tRNA hydrolase [Nocardioides coralli]